MPESLRAAGPGWGLTERGIKRLSELKHEPKWMLRLRLRAYEAFKRLPWLSREMPALEGLRLAELVVPPGATGLARGRLADSDLVERRMGEELSRQGVAFLDLEKAFRDFPELFRRHFGSVVRVSEDKLAALNAALWSGGAFVYVPKGLQLALPLQAFVRLEARRSSFEPTLVVADEGSSLLFLEGCEASAGAASLHASVVEVVALRGARVRYMTLQNWPQGVLNLVHKRAIAHEGACVEWLDLNLGSRLTMKHPGVILAGRGARGEILSCALARSGQEQDAGGELVFAAPETSGRVLSRSVVRGGGRATCRVFARDRAGAREARLSVKAEALALDSQSRFEFCPGFELAPSRVALEREACVSRLEPERLFYLASRGLREKEAQALLVQGFFEPFSRELPLEYSVEFLRLVQLGLED